MIVDLGVVHVGFVRSCKLASEKRTIAMSTRVFAAASVLLFSCHSMAEDRMGASTKFRAPRPVAGKPKRGY